MSQPTDDVTGVPEEEGTTGLAGEEEELPQEEGFIDTDEEEVDEEEDPPEGEEEEGADAAEVAVLGAITRPEVLRRGLSWIRERVMYSQKPPPHCNRYGCYRRDCSGYVSMCWRLGRSYTTATIMQVAHRISRSQLRPGDALWRRRGGRGHIALFRARDSRGRVVVWEEYTRGQPCRQRTWSRRRESSFTPIRYNRIG